MNEWMNEYVYLSLKQNFYNEMQLDSTQLCIIIKNISGNIGNFIVFPIVSYRLPCGFSYVVGFYLQP